jgi:succinate dehydrogenase / fumarate reductase, membrane anchor subunit
MGSGTGLGRVRGLGSAKHGAGHWINQRITAAGNLLLVLWLLFSFARLSDLGHAAVVEWIAQPLVAVSLMLLIISVFWHFRLGLQVFIEDYVHDEALKFASFIALNFYCVGLGATALFAIAKIAFTGAK